MEDNYVIEMLNITKTFPGIIANDNISLQLKKGEIHALLGENGAGKSTLMSVLFGLYQPEQGIIKKDGKEVKISNPNDATKLGIGMVHQHFKLVNIFSVLDNIILGLEPMKYGVFVDRKKARKKVVELSEKYGLKIDPDAKIENISVGMQQRVEILKMLYRDAEILIFDEPTAVLTPQEIDELMKIMKGFAKQGKSILFISHKLNEIMDVADRVTILRKGKYIDTLNVEDTTKEQLAELMVGRKVSFSIDKTEAKPQDVVLKVDDLCVKSKLNNKLVNNHVSFEVRSGEIVCVGGIEGNGQTELVYAISGIEKPESGHIYYNGKDITNENIRERNDSGMSHIPEDRQKYGLILDYPLSYNLVLKKYYKKEFCKNGVLREKEIEKYSDYLIEKYDIRSGQGSETMARSMSGGNQQKAIVAREIDYQGKLLLAVQPTRGLDVGAIEFIHKQIVKARDEGAAILLVSLELDEVMDLSDKILIMYNGEITGEFDPKVASIPELGLYMAGAKKMRKYGGND